MKILRTLLATFSFVSCASATVQQVPLPSSRIQKVCQLIQSNCEKEEQENNLPPRSIYYKVIEKINSCIKSLSTPPLAEYLCITQSSNILKVDFNGEYVVLARFPPEGKTLEVFGLNPSTLKGIAIPNDLREWPEKALDGCLHLQALTVYGPENETESLQLKLTHNLRALTELKILQLPSTITNFQGCRWEVKTTICPQNIQSILLPKRLKEMGACNFYNCTTPNFIDFENCRDLEKTGQATFRYSFFTYINFLHCENLKNIGALAFGSCPVEFILFPASLRSIEFEAFTNIRALKTIIWKGRSERLPVVNNDYPVDGISSRNFGGSLENLVSSGQLTEIFIP